MDRINLSKIYMDFKNYVRNLVEKEELKRLKKIEEKLEAPEKPKPAKREKSRLKAFFTCNFRSSCCDKEE